MVKPYHPLQNKFFPFWDRFEVHTDLSHVVLLCLPLVLCVFLLFIFIKRVKLYKKKFQKRGVPCASSKLVSLLNFPVTIPCQWKKRWKYRLSELIFWEVTSQILYIIVISPFIVLYTLQILHREVVFIIEKNLQTTRVDSWVYSFKQTSI